MSRPAFSVIIAAYNAERTLARAIRSVLEQTWPAHELIVVDDGSTDGTLEAARSFGARVVCLHQANAGVSAARNAGADRATGDWLAFLDADDWYYPDRLRWHAEWIARDPALDFLTGDSEYRRPDGTLISRSMEITAAGRAMLAKARGAREVIMEDAGARAVRRAAFRRHAHAQRAAPQLHGAGRLSARAGRVRGREPADPLERAQSAGRSGVRASGCVLRAPAQRDRRDPLRAQRLTVEALLPLKATLRGTSAAVYKGYLGRLRLARLNLAYALLRSGRGARALRAVLPLLVDLHRPAAARDVLSIAWSALQQALGARVT